MYACLKITEMNLLLLILCVFSLKVFCLNDNIVDKDIERKEKPHTIGDDTYDYKSSLLENSTISDKYYDSTKNTIYFDYENSTINDEYYDYKHSTSNNEYYNYNFDYDESYISVYEKYKLLYKGKSWIYKRAGSLKHVY